MKKVLYIDTDTIIQSDLSDLWNLDIEESILIGKKSTIEFQISREKELNCQFDRYVNSGVLLINLDRWRELEAEKRIIKAYNDNKGFMRFADQDAINLGIGNEIRDDLPPQYNQGFEKNTFRMADILHYGGFVARGNPRAFRNLYNQYLERTPFGKQKRLVVAPIKRKLKDTLWVYLRCGYFPKGDKIYHLLTDRRG